MINRLPAGQKIRHYTYLLNQAIRKAGRIPRHTFVMITINLSRREAKELK